MNLKIVTGDITKLEVDIIVNAANTGLLGGGGVDGAIHSAAGPKLLAECLKLRRPGKTGEAYLTSAGALPCRWVIHTPGPVWRGGDHNETQLLANCYRNALGIATELRAESIAFPCISTGVYHFPKREAATIALETVKNHSGDYPQLVVFCCFSPEDAALYRQLAADE